MTTGHRRWMERGWPGEVGVSRASLPTYDADAPRLTFRRANHDVDVPPEACEHAQEALGGEATQLARHDERNLRWRIAHDVGSFGLGQVLMVENVGNLLRQNILRDHRIGARPLRAAFRVGSGHGRLGKLD